MSLPKYLISTRKVEWDCGDPQCCSDSGYAYDVYELRESTQEYDIFVFDGDWEGNRDEERRIQDAISRLKYYLDDKELVEDVDYKVEKSIN